MRPEQTPPPPRRSRQRTTLRRTLPLALLLVLAALAWWRYGDLLSFQALADNRQALIDWRSANYALAALVFVAVYVGAVALSVPGAVFLTLAGGLMFGLVPATLMVVLAATLGATIIFAAARAGFGAALHARMAANGGTLARIEQGLRANEISYLLVMRLVPAVPFFVANLAPALLGVGLRNFVLTTFFGIMPGTAVYVSVGAGLGEIIARGETPDLGIIFDWPVLGPLLGLAALSLVPAVLRAIRGKETAG